MFKEYTQYDAIALAALVNAGEVSAKELSKPISLILN